ncbi:tyrosine-type recombinase/integrase [Neomoorella mulderi]|uniref:tyrosine-type recombinase/integrase n=1 Tax=Neomoorella mulderi TaxID=202604 RepID=UPI000A8F3934
MLDKAGLPWDTHFHALRHTFATSLLHNGIDIKTVSAWLGHANAGSPTGCTTTTCRKNSTTGRRSGSTPSSSAAGTQKRPAIHDCHPWRFQVNKM